jgi:hypothetical protein
MEKNELFLVGLIFLMVLVGVTLTALVSGYSSHVINDFPLYSLPFIGFIISLLIAAYVLAERVIPASKPYLVKLSMILGAVFFMAVLFTLTIFLFQTFAITKTLELVRPEADISGPFMNLVYLIGALGAGVLLGIALLDYQWKGNATAKYALTVLTIITVYGLGSPPWELFFGFLFLVSVWASVLVKGKAKPKAKPTKRRKRKSK